MKGLRVILGVCGGIAAYKAADLVSKLAQQGALVTVAMTPEAQKFVGPLTFEALSGRKVLSDPWVLQESADPQHIALTEQSDILVIAPATANMLAKMAHGLCDDLVSLMALAAACPVAVAPAMNNRMWEHPATQDNVATLKRAGVSVIGPADGWLACRNVGAGRMAEPAEILAAIEQIVKNAGGEKSRPSRPGAEII